MPVPAESVHKERLRETASAAVPVDYLTDSPESTMSFTSPQLGASGANEGIATAGTKAALTSHRVWRCLPTRIRFPWCLGGDTHESEAEDQGLHAFLATMLGPASTADSAEAVDEASDDGDLRLEELTAGSAYALLCAAGGTSSPSSTSPSSSSGGEAGLIHALRPYLADLLVRRQSFHCIAEVLMAAAMALTGTECDNVAAAARAITEITGKDLIVALLLAVPKQRQASLARAYAELGAPLPIVFRAPVREPSGALSTLFALDVLQELACVPHAGRQLLVSMGTRRAAGGGKTTLLAALSLTGRAALADFDVRPSGPTHIGSCDLFCADPARWLVDAHGHWAGWSEELRTAVLALVLWSGAVCLVHCTMGDFQKNTGFVGRELAELLNTVGSTTQGGRACIIALVRDVSVEAFAPRRAAIECALRQHKAFGVLPVDDFRIFRSSARSERAAEQLRASLDDLLAKASPQGASTPSIEELRRVFQGLFEVRCGALQGSPITAGHEMVHALAGLWAKQARWSSVAGAEFVAHLDTAAQSAEGVSTALFPLSTMARRLALLRRVLTDGGTSMCNELGRSRGTRSALQLQLEEDHTHVTAAELSRLEQDFNSSKSSDAVIFFSQRAASGDLAIIAELRLYLEDWNEHRRTLLVQRQRELLDLCSTPGGQRDCPPKKELESIIGKLSELDFCVDSFWAELGLLAQRHESGERSNKEVGVVNYDEALMCRVACLKQGHPFQVLHGRPLQMAGGLLRRVLQAIDAQHAEPIGVYVVSVIGAQSSAKSTLLNVLFGCGFDVHAGRCTCGLYASYFCAVGGPAVLVLDSEGLMSLGSDGNVFDRQIALMCMACSHLVLVNHMGELSRHLQDLLEVSLFALRHLRLARLRPRLVFVLRDQQDRSAAVYEDMLKQMRSHLSDAARTLGLPLDDIVRLSGTGVFLLPSAFTSEVRQGREVSWTSELFGREVLRLRADIFRCLREDVKTYAGGGPPEFSSLERWHDYANAVWETLEEFGQQLLHYRTICEIELRRELANVAKTAVQDTLDGLSGNAVMASSAAVGFQTRATRIVDSFITRIQARHAVLDLTTANMQLHRALESLRDESVSQLEELFLERAGGDPRFSATAKEQAKEQMRTPIDWAFKNHLYTWKLHFKKASDEQAMHELWHHFTEVLGRHLAGSGYRSCLAEAEARESFESEWHAYEAQFLDRQRSLTKDWCALADEATLLFNHAVAKLQHEAGVLALLKEVGPQQIAPGKAACIVEQTDEEWEEQYFHAGWWASTKKHGLAVLQTAGVPNATSGAAADRGGAATLSNGGFATTCTLAVFPRMRQIVILALQAFKAQVVERSGLDEGMAAEGLRHIAGVVLEDVERCLVASGGGTESSSLTSTTLKRPQMLHSLQVALRISCVEALVAVESERHQKAMADLHAQKAHVQEHYVLAVLASKGDVERASNLAALFHRSLNRWLGHEVTRLAVDVRSQVLREMPDPQKSSERAFQNSFVACNWPDVLEYVLDMNAYLEKMFLTLFHQCKGSHVGVARSRLETCAVAVYRLLHDVAGQWARSVTPVDGDALSEVPVVGGPPLALRQRSVQELNDYVSTGAERVAACVDGVELHRQLAACVPATADFPITDPRLFVEAFQSRISDYIDDPEMPHQLARQFDNAIKEQSVHAWSLIHGCSERCPLCGSKCDRVGEHCHHQCGHHLFPAFHGWMDNNTGLPSFNHCLSTATRAGKYECKDGVWRSLEDYLRIDHTDWLPFVHDQAAGQRDVQHLRAAWVKCRMPLLKFFSPMEDFCPEEWTQAYADEGPPALCCDDLQTAKETIRKLRDHTWSPLGD